MTTQQQTVGWTPERTELARRLYVVEGRSATEVAAALGGGVTRAAVIGKAHRGRWLADQTTPRVTASTKVKASGATSPKSTFGCTTYEAPEVAAKRRSAATAAGKAKIDAFAFPANDTAVPLLHRAFGQCSWPVGEPDQKAQQLCCGLPVDPRANKAVPTYCPQHGKLAMSPRAQSAPRSAKAFEKSLRRWAA